jgi:signal peptidase II
MQNKWLLILPAGLAIDRLTKNWAMRAAAEAAGDVFALWPGVIGFRYAQNTGMAFSFFSGHPLALIASAAVLAAVSLLIAILNKRLSAGLRAGLILMSAGGIGNITDRLAYGYVVDFMEFLFIDFAIFNMADVFITIGAAAVVIALLTGRDANAHTRTDSGA